MSQMVPTWDFDCATCGSVVDGGTEWHGTADGTTWVKDADGTWRGFSPGGSKPMEGHAPIPGLLYGPKLDQALTAAAIDSASFERQAFRAAFVAGTDGNYVGALAVLMAPTARTFYRSAMYGRTPTWGYRFKMLGFAALMFLSDGAMGVITGAGDVTAGSIGIVGSLGGDGAAASVVDAVADVAVADGTAAAEGAVADAINSVPAKFFRRFKCEECANAMADALTARGIRGELLTIRANSGDYMVNDLISGSKSITTNGIHQAVRVGDVVYDNFFRAGVSYQTYVRSLHADAGISITATGF
jgi:hypothetical protein